MDCPDARDLLVDLRRGRLPPARRDEVRAHLSGCDACRKLEANEAALDELLDRALPRRTASAALKDRLARMADAGPGAAPDEGHRARRRWTRLLAPALSAGLALAVVGLLVERTTPHDGASHPAVVAEAVSDHLRTLASERGPDLVSGDSHQVKPWFEGRIDFAPVVPLPDVPELRLRGGSVGYFLDRKAAVVGYTLRRHSVTLLAFRPDGLELPAVAGPDGSVRTSNASSRGFRVATWRASEVGYALVSDVAPEELDALAATFAAITAR